MEARENSLTAPFVRLLVSHFSWAPSVFECLLIFSIVLPAAQALIELDESSDRLYCMQGSFVSPQCYSVHRLIACTVYHSGVVLCCPQLTPCCLCPVRFDYCRFIELDYVPMEAGYMVSMRPTKGYASTKSPTKGYASTKSPDRHSRSTNSPSTPRSRSVLSPTFMHGNDETLCSVVNVL